MKLNFILSTIFTLYISTFAFGGNNEISWDAKLIPDSLKQNSNAVVRESKIVYEYKSPQSGKYRVSTAVTILNNKGDSYANFSFFGDRYSNLSSFSGKVCDANGKTLFKIKKSEVQSSEYSRYLASDDIFYYYNCTPPTYPCTIVYEYEVLFKNGIITFPSFVPQFSNDIAVQQASYLLLTAPDMVILYKSDRLPAPVIGPEESKQKSYYWSVQNLKAYKEESMEPKDSVLYPRLLVRPQNFIYDGISGEISDWNSMGKWIYSLLSQRQTLPDEVKKKIIALTENATSDREKVTILYDYLGRTTRYEAIMLGIGGYQPMPASEVARVGFGDCKALSNYMKAMLECIGIDSYYTIIQADADKKNIFEDYANFHQFNHVILQVPLKEDTLWLECTNTQVPLGFIHNHIAGHQALVVSEEGGSIVRLPDYGDSQNIDKFVSEIKVLKEGKATGKTSNYNVAKIYDQYMWFTKADYSKQIEYLRKNITLPNASITKLTCVDEKKSIPQLIVHQEWETPLFGTKTGSRLFMPVNTFRQMYTSLPHPPRKNDIEVNEGSIHEDSITVIIPENFIIESIPATINYTSPMGSFYSNISVDKNRIFIHQRLHRKSGYWSAKNYPELLTLISKINEGYKGQIIIKPQP